MVTTARTAATEELKQAFFKAAAQEEFWRVHWEEFRQTYPDLFVVIQQGEVIEVGPDLVQLVGRLTARGIVPGECWIRYVIDQSITILH